MEDRVARVPLRLSIQQVINYLQEEVRRTESHKLLWEKERRAILGRCVYLEGIVNQHDGIVSLLERRIAMLEHMLQQERSRAYSMGEASTSLQGSGAAEDALVSHPISQVSTPSFNSPGASKENIEPDQPLPAGRTRMSPGFSPLGRKHKKRTENASVEATGSQVSHASRRRHAQRSLIFDDGEASKDLQLNSSKQPKASECQQTQQSIIGLGMAPSTPSTTCSIIANQISFVQPEQARDERFKRSDAASSLGCQQDVVIAYEPEGPSLNKAVAFYPFPEDGEGVAAAVHIGNDTNLLAAVFGGEERPILAELEGIVTKSPPMSVKKAAKPSMDLLTEDIGRVALNKDASKQCSPASSYSSPMTSPIRV